MIFIINTLKICFVIIGTIIGAGFASGKEIFTFFCVYGKYGLSGIFISNILIGLVIFFTIKIIKKNNIKNYYEFINYLFGNNKLINYTINNIMNLFLFISFIVMISGFGAYFNQEYNLPIFLGALIISCFAFITFFKNINGIIKINSILIPCLLFLIVFLGIKDNILKFNINNLNNSIHSSWLLKSILYASYNSIILIPIIINLNNFIKSNKENCYITFFTIFFMTIMSIIIYNVLCLNIPRINNIDIPIVYIAGKFRSFF